VLLVGNPVMLDPLISVLAESIENKPVKYLGTMSVTDELPDERSSYCAKDLGPPRILIDLKFNPNENDG
jgi:hypothetical protein